MPFHNPFIKDGRITFPDNGNLVRHIERWAKVRGEQGRLPVPGFLRRARRRRARSELGHFSVRNRAVAARLQQVTQPGDRVAILCPQSLEYLVAFFGTLYAGRIAVPAVRPVRTGPRRPVARRPGRLLSDRDPDHHRIRRRRPQVLPQPAGQGTAPRHRRRRRPGRGRRDLGACRGRPRHHRLPAVHLGIHPDPDRCGDHPPQPGHQRRPDHRGAGGGGG